MFLVDRVDPRTAARRSILFCLGEAIKFTRTKSLEHMCQCIASSSTRYISFWAKGMR